MKDLEPFIGCQFFAVGSDLAKVGREFKCDPGKESSGFRDIVLESGNGNVFLLDQIVAFSQIFQD